MLAVCQKDILLYITEEGYSGMHDQTMRGEHCAVLCETGKCSGDCDRCKVYKNKYFDWGSEE
ncbi:MAG: hypothetical protein ACTSR5_16000 [Promethearchaeota archaeon]